MSVNEIWNFFEKVADPRKARCKECDKLYSLGSDKPKMQTINGLKNHLEKCHKELDSDYLKRVAETDEERASKKVKVDFTTERSVPVFIQPTLDATQVRRLPLADDSDVAKRIDKAVMDLIIVDMLPYTIVEGDAFKRLNFADPAGVRRYKLKSEKYYRTSLMPATYDKVAEHVRLQLAEAKWVSFTTDVWTNPTNTCSLLSFTGHFLHGPNRYKLVLSAMVLEEDHNGVYLARKLSEAITAWGLQGKVHIGVRDNGANITSAMHIAEVRDMGCVAHTLQSVIHDALFTQTSVEAVVKKARKIVAHFKHSEQACRKFVDCQQSCDVVVHKPLQDVETRWNSTYIMIERLVEQRRAVNLFSVDHGAIDTLSSSEWELADRLVRVLKPLYEATLEISSDDACISVVVPLITMLLGQMQSTSDDRGLLQMKAALRDAINRRFACMKTAPHIIAVTLLDPRFKDAYLSLQESAAAKTEVVNFLRSVHSAVAMTPESSENQQAQIARPDTFEATLSPSTSFSLWDAHDRLSLAAQTETSDTAQGLAYERQLDTYLLEPRLPRSTDIFGYWHCSQYPSLEPAAQKYLSAPPTSVASEQLFSSAGQLYADRRSNLLGENAEKLLFLAYNVRLLNFNY